MFDIAQEDPVTISQARRNLAEQGINLHKPGYRTSGFLIAARAIEFGMPVRQFDVTHLVMTQGMLRGLDDLVDNDGMADISDAVGLVSEGKPIDGLITRAEAGVFSKLLEVYDDERREQQLTGLINWPVFEKAKCEAETFEEYTAGISVEADAYVGLIKTIKPESADPEGQIRARVNRWTRNLICAGYWADYARDLGKDYRKGRCQIEPSLSARLQLARLTFKEGGAELLRSTPPRLLPKIARLVINYAIQ